MRILFVVAALSLSLVGFMKGQEPECPDLPRLPEKKPPEPGGLVDGVTKTSGVVDVIVGQSRILATKGDLAPAGKRPPVIAVGDPTVIDFRVLDARFIRIVGERIGVTDLSIVTADREVYNFEVRVVADLCILDAQIKKSFKGAKVKLSQIRDHVLIEGTATSAKQSLRIADTVRAYLLSVAVGMDRKTTATQQPGAKEKPGEIPPPKKNGKDDKEKKDEKIPLAGPESPGQGYEVKIPRPRVINMLVVDNVAEINERLKELFPDANVTATQVGDSIVLKGQARSYLERDRIVATVKAHMAHVLSIEAAEAKAAVGNQEAPTPGVGAGVTIVTAQQPGEKAAAPSVINLIHVPIDYLGDLETHLAKLFPDACVRVSQIGSAIVLEGQARDPGQVTRIVDATRAYRARLVAMQAAIAKAEGIAEPLQTVENTGGGNQTIINVGGQGGQQTQTKEPPDIINLLRVPGSRQVMLKVKVAELNRTALRQIGTDLLLTPGKNVIGTNIGGNTVNASASRVSRFLSGSSSLATGPTTTIFGIFENADFAIFMSALRRNTVLKILAEPNLVALNGEKASFLAGGSFPVPVPQTGGGGIAPTITVQFQDFGVKLNFQPFILDGEIVRLSVDPEVSTVDFTLGTVLVPGGSPVPGLNIRRAHTVVELKEGQTLAIAGLLQLTLDGTTSRIPGIGDLPVLGPFFSNTSGNRIEKELIVLVTPHLVEPMTCDQVPPAPGDEVNEPTDLERYLCMRIEGRTGRDFRSTVEYECQLPALRSLMRMEDVNIIGPHGFCD